MKKIVLYLLLIVFLIACDDEVKRTNYPCQFSIVCSNCTVTVKDNINIVSTFENLNTLWKYKFYSKPGQFLYLYAKSSNKDEIVSVSITVDNRIVKESVGLKYAEASYTLPN